MINSKHSRAVWALAILMPLAVTACAETEMEKPMAPAAATSMSSAPPPRGSGVYRENLIQEEATVQAIDRTNRRVTLRDDDGEVVTVKAPADARLDEINVGDRVAIAYYESVAINLADPRAPLGAAGAAAQVKAAPTETPGRAVGEQVVVTAQVVGINAFTNEITFRTGKGRIHTVAVKDPDLQRRIPNVRLGDVLVFTHTEAVAVRILPKR